MSEDGHGTSWDPIKVEGEAPDEPAAADAEAPVTEAPATEADDATEDADPDETALAVEVAHSVSATADAVAPPLYEWDRTTATANVPPRDAYALRLVVGRTLYDNGRVVRETPILTGLVAAPALRINPHALAALGVDAGTQVRITGARTSLTRPVVGDAAVPAGVAFLPFPADGTGPAELIDVTAPVTDVRVETLR